MKNAVEYISRENVLFLSDNLKIVYKHGRVFVRKPGTKISFSFRIISKKWQYFLAKIGLFERLLRLAPREAVQTIDGKIYFPCTGYLYELDPDKKEMKSVLQFNIGTNTPLHCNAIDWDNKPAIVFGDYNGHDSNGNSGIYLYSDGNCTEIASFPHDSIAHIHNVIFDKQRDLFWIFTGDSDFESGIWYLEKGTHVPKPFLVGSQQYRACIGFVEEDEIIYATDSPIEENYVYSVNINTKEKRMIGSLPGPCVFGKKYWCEGDTFFVFSTTVEGDSSLPRWRYLFSNRIGPSLVDRYSHMFMLTEKKVLYEIMKIKKDFLPLLLFQFGTIKLLEQNTATGFYVVTQNAVQCKRGLYKINMEKKV